MTETTERVWQRHLGLFGGYNETLGGDGFSISYNPNPGDGLSLFMSDDGGPETAIVTPDECLILNGDYRDSYESLIDQGLDACERFYRKQAVRHGSSWTERKQQ